MFEVESRVGAQVGDSPMWKEDRDTVRKKSRRKAVRMTEHTCPRSPLRDFGRCDLGVEQHLFLESKAQVSNSQFFPFPFVFFPLQSRRASPNFSKQSPVSQH